MGFYYRDTADIIQWLLVFNKSPWMRNYLTKDLVRKIADYMVTWIGVSKEERRFNPNLITTEWEKQLIQKRNGVFDNWYTQRHTHISDFARREGATTLIVAMANCIPPKYSVLILCTCRRAAEPMWEMLSLQRKLKNTQVSSIESNAGTGEDFDFVFGDTVDASHLRPRGKLLYFL